MKKQAYTFLVIPTLSAIFWVMPVHAQSDRLIAATVPFNFVTTDRSLPAGEYVFSLVQVGATRVIKIQSADGHITALVPTRRARAKGLQSEPKLVFIRFEDQYFLSLVCGLDDYAVQQLSELRTEDPLARRVTEQRKVPIAAHKR